MFYRFLIGEYSESVSLARSLFSNDFVVVIVYNLIDSCVTKHVWLVILWSDVVALLSTYLLPQSNFCCYHMAQWNLFNVVNSIILKFPAVLKFPDDDL